jgi:CheY-like chemotaxis protein
LRKDGATAILSSYMARHAKIVIVDDDPDIRDNLGEGLREEGYEVAQFSSGREALDYLRGGVHADVILLDLFMPGLDGWDFRAEQKSDPRTAAIPVISLSAAGNLSDVAYSLRKPAGVDEIIRAIEGVTRPA